MKPNMQDLLIDLARVCSNHQVTILEGVFYSAGNHACEVTVDLEAMRCGARGEGVSLELAKRGVHWTES